MKTLKMSSISMFLMLATALAVTACGSKNSSNTTNSGLACSTTTQTTGYGSNSYNTTYSSGYNNGYNGGYNNGNNNGYAGTLYANGTVVQQSQCASVNGTPINNGVYGNTGYNNGYGNTGGQIAGYYGGQPVYLQSCNGGTFRDMQGNQGSCYSTGYNGSASICSGKLLQNLQNGQLVLCQ
jgi:hypothetical protein